MTDLDIYQGHKAGLIKREQERELRNSHTSIRHFKTFYSFEAKVFGLRLISEWVQPDSAASAEHDSMIAYQACQAMQTSASSCMSYESREEYIKKSRLARAKMTSSKSVTTTRSRAHILSQSELLRHRKYRLFDRNRHRQRTLLRRVIALTSTYISVSALTFQLHPQFSISLFIEMYSLLRIQVQVRDER